MKKYIQITTVLAAFFLLVFAKNLKGNEDEVAIVGKKIEPTTSATNTATPTPQKLPAFSFPTSTPTPQQTLKKKFKDGTYDGSIEDAFYGNLQVQAVIRDGRLVDVKPLLYPNDNRTSILINSQAFPMLRDEALNAQSPNVDIISGASDSSPAFERSLSSALKKAQ